MHADLPIHPTTGLRALGVLPSGRIVWPVVGAADDNTGGAQESGDTTPTGGLTQADVDRIVQQRLAREREKYSDYDDLKAKATEFDQLQDAQRSDLEKAQAAAAEALKRAEDAERRARVATAARTHGLPDDLVQFLDGATDAEVEEKAKALAKYANAAPGQTSGEEPDHRPGGQPDPSQGRGSSGKGAGSLAAGADRYRQKTRKTT